MPLALVLVLAGGCGSGPSKTADEDKKAPDDVAAKPAPELAESGETLPMPLDGDRIRVTPPKGWTFGSQVKKYVIYFQREPEVGPDGKRPPRSTYPALAIMAEDYEGVETVTKDNAEEFAKQLAAAMKKAGDNLSHPVRAFSFGDWAGATYQQRVKAGPIELDRRRLETVAGNRKYTFELLTLGGTVEKYWPHLLALAAGVEYLKAGAPPKEKTAEKTPSPPPEEKPEKTEEKAPAGPVEKTPEAKTPAKKRPTFEEDL